MQGDAFGGVHVGGQVGEGWEVEFDEFNRVGSGEVWVYGLEVYMGGTYVNLEDGSVFCEPFG